MKWRRETADLGHVVSEAFLAYAHWNGRGLPQDRGQARQLWSEFGAESDDPESLSKLAAIHLPF